MPEAAQPPAQLTPAAHQPAGVEGSSRAQLAAQPGGCFGEVQVAHLSQGTGSFSVYIHGREMLRFRLHTCWQGLADFRFARDSALRLRWAARQGRHAAHRRGAAAGHPLPHSKLGCLLSCLPGPRIILYTAQGRPAPTLARHAASTRMLGDLMSLRAVDG